jgi:hypothetical protein
LLTHGQAPAELLLAAGVVEAVTETQQVLVALVAVAVATAVAALQIQVAVAQEIMRCKTLQTGLQEAPVLLSFVTLAHNAALVER